MRPNILKNILLTCLLFAFFSLPLKIMAQQQCYYNQCTQGPICELGCQFYSPGDYVQDSTLNFYTADEKIFYHPYWDEYKDFTCRAQDCFSAPTDTWYCASNLEPDRDGDPAVRRCTSLTFPNCETGGEYCEVGSKRYLGWAEYCPGGFFECRDSGWACNPNYEESGPCWPSPHPVCWCDDGAYDSLNSGTWMCDSSVIPYDAPDSGACEEMLEQTQIGFSPGYVKTSTPYLFQIHQNIVGKVQSIFSLFKLGIYDAPEWSGETTINYGFAPYEGRGWAEAGNPESPIHPGSDAHIYFRYLGGIHCEKEKLLKRLSPILNIGFPYVFYDLRCDYQTP